MASNAEQVVTIGRHLQVQTPRQEVVPVALVAGIAKQILEDDSSAGEVGNPERQETAPRGRAEIRDRKPE